MSIPVRPEFFEKVPKEVLREILLDKNDNIDDVISMCSTSKYVDNIVCDQNFIQKLAIQYGMKKNIKTMKELDKNKKNIIKLIQSDLMEYYKYSGSDDEKYNRWEKFLDLDVEEDPGFKLYISSVWYTGKEYVAVWKVKEIDSSIKVSNDYVDTSKVTVSKINFNLGFKYDYIGKSSYMTENVIDFVLSKDFNDTTKLKNEIKKFFKLKRLFLFDSDLSETEGYYDYEEIVENIHPEL